MTIQLTRDQIAILRKQVVAGRYSSIETALDCIIAGSELEDEFDDNFDEWARPLIAEGIAEADRGELISFEQFAAEVEARLKSRGE